MIKLVEHLTKVEFSFWKTHLWFQKINTAHYVLELYPMSMVDL